MTAAPSSHKDAVMSSSMLSELIAYYQSKGTSAYHILEEIYRKYGYYSESQKSITLKGQDGAAQIIKIMDGLRKSPPKKIGKYDVLKKIDLETGEVYDMNEGKVSGKWAVASSNVIIFQLSDNAKVIGRPSGTEPKIKFYFTSCGKPKAQSETIDQLISRVNLEHEELKKNFLGLLG